MIAIRRKREPGGRTYEPTPKNIQQACEQIQAMWSQQERAKRYRGPCAAWWTPPTIPLRDLLEDGNEDGGNSMPYFGAPGNEAEFFGKG